MNPVEVDALFSILWGLSESENTFLGQLLRTSSAFLFVLKWIATPPLGRLYANSTSLNSECCFKLSCITFEDLKSCAPLILSTIT